ncbi:type VI secretion system Vgr family protein [Acidisoma sp. C75]
MDRPVFTIAINGLSGPAPTVARFEGRESLTQPYVFEIDLVSEDADLPLDDLIGQPASLSLSLGETTRQIHGIVRQIAAGAEADGGAYAYHLRLVPRLALLELGRHNRTFGTKAPMTVLEVIEAVLQDPTGLAFTQGDYSIRVMDRASYPKRELWVQYGETDRDFLHRLVEHWGLFYYFEQTAESERVVFCDSTSTLPINAAEAALPYQGSAGAVPLGTPQVQQLSRTLQTVSKSIRLKDYNAEHPSLTLATSAEVHHGTLGEYDEYAPHFLSSAEGDFFARLRAEEIAARRDRFEFTTTSPFAAAGAIFEVDGHFRSGFNQSYLPVAIRHEGQQGIAQAFTEARSAPTGAYHNRIEAIPAKAPYRSPRITPKPNMSGIMPAVVEVDESRPNTDRAAIDAQGRYKVALDFDSSDNPVYERSPYLRRVQPYAGPDVGFHFPLLKQTEVMIGWMDGDPDRPIILGAIPNAETVGPVAKTNHTENKMRTASGIALVMNDGPGQSSSSGGSESESTGGSSSAQAAPARASSRAAPEDRGHSVYSSLMVPASGGGAPHYLRLGDVAPADGQEDQIMGTSVFAPRHMAHRGKTLNNRDYAGIFSYTGQNRTSTIGAHETVSVGGDFRQYVTGTATSVVGGRKAAASQDASGSSGSSSGGAASDSTPTDVSTPALASTGAVVAIATNTDAYVCYLNYVPLITFCDTMQASYTLGVSYTLWGGFAASVSLGGQFSTMQGGTASVGANFAYAIGRNGGLSDGTNILDSSFSFYATEGSIILGCRPISGTPIMADAAETALAATVASYTGGIIGEMGQGAVIAQESLGTTPSSVLGVAAQAVSATAAGLAYAASVATGKAYFDGTVNTLTPPDVLQEPTLSISSANGITLTAGTSSLRITELGIFLAAGANTLSLNAGGVEINVDATRIMVTPDDIGLESPETVIDSPYVEITGKTTVDQSLYVLQSMFVTASLSAATIAAGA